MQETYWDKELLDFVHGVSHAQVSLWNGSGHLDEDVQLHGQVCVFSLTTLPQLFLLEDTSQPTVSIT